MDHPRITSTEFQQAFGQWTEKVAEEPVTITKEGRDHLVVLSADEYARLERRDRHVGLASELPEEWVEAVQNAKVPNKYAHLDTELE